MKKYILISLSMIFVSLVSGQTAPQSSATPKPPDSPEKRFGYSLEKYKKRDQRQTGERRVASDDDDVIKVQTDLVANDIYVTDRNGNLVTNLGKDDFIVTENDMPQAIEMFSAAESASKPKAIVLILDNSIGQAAYHKNSIEAAKGLIDKLNPNDKVAIVTANTNLLTDFTPDKNKLKDSLDFLERKYVQAGSGLEFECLLAVLNELFATEDSRRIVIFQGDGNEIIWLKTDEDAPYKVSKSTRDLSGMMFLGEKKSISYFGFSEVKEAIERSQTTIFSIVSGMRFLGLSKKEQSERSRLSFDKSMDIFKIKDTNRAFIRRTFQDVDLERQIAGQTAMSKIAELSGGTISFLEKPEDAQNVYSDIFKNISSRYFIGYYSTNQQSAGENARSIKIEVKNHPEYKVSGIKNK